MEAQLASFYLPPMVEQEQILAATLSSLVWKHMNFAMIDGKIKLCRCIKGFVDDTTAGTNDFGEDPIAVGACIIAALQL